jgi:Bacterial archaeo-eukaryotic release factor family 3
MTTLVGLNHKTLCALVDWEAPLLVSAFVPVDYSRPQASVALTKALRHAAQTAINRLTHEHGVEPGAAAEWVAPLLADSVLENVSSSVRGLAVFMSPGRAVHLALPVEIGPAVEVGDRVDLLRLLPAFVDDIEFFALTIDKKGARLFRGSRFEFHSVPVLDMPGSIDEALWYIRREPVLNRQGSGVLHGAGGGQDLRKDDVRQYIHLIDKAITPALNGARAPLVVFGVEYEAAMFINHTHYRHTVEIAVSGSPESMSNDELHQQSWEFVQSQVQTSDEALERLRRLDGTGKTATDPSDVVAASSSGSVSDLLVARSLTDAGEIPPPASGRSAIVSAVNESFRHRARIHVVDDDALPGGVSVAAVLRY